MGLNSSWRGRFNCIDGWFDFDIIKSADDYCSGIVNGHTLPATYSFYRKPGADAVLKKLGEPDIKSISGSLAYNLERVPQNAQAGISAPSGYVITKINITSVTSNADVAYRFTTNTGVNQGFTGAMSKDLGSVSSVTVICEKTQNITAVSGSVSFNVEISKQD